MTRLGAAPTHGSGGRTWRSPGTRRDRAAVVDGCRAGGHDSLVSPEIYFGNDGHNPPTDYD
jgi:hypothetical protein